MRSRVPKPAADPPQKIMGVDPGLAALGFGVVSAHRRNASYITSGTITTSSRNVYADRLKKLYQELQSVLEEHRPAILVMERPIYCQNIKTALTLGQAGGVAVLAAANAGVKLVEFTPLQVKKSVTGKGNASKEQVWKMVELILGLKEPLGSEHESDALACAICYTHSIAALSKSD